MQKKMTIVKNANGTAIRQPIEVRMVAKDPNFKIQPFTWIDIENVQIKLSGEWVNASNVRAIFLDEQGNVSKSISESSGIGDAADRAQIYQKQQQDRAFETCIEVILWIVDRVKVWEESPGQYRAEWVADEKEDFYTTNEGVVELVRGVYEKVLLARRLEGKDRAKEKEE